jgi:hypothetical protein
MNRVNAVSIPMEESRHNLQPENKTSKMNSIHNENTGLGLLPIPVKIACIK